MMFYGGVLKWSPSRCKANKHRLFDANNVLSYTSSGATKVGAGKRLMARRVMLMCPDSSGNAMKKTMQFWMIWG